MPTTALAYHGNSFPSGPINSPDFSSSNAHFAINSAACSGVFAPDPVAWLFSFVVVNPGVSALTTAFPLSSFASAMVYEFAAALDVLYATTCRAESGRAWNVLDAMSVEMFRMFGLGADDLSTSGRRAVVVWMRPKRLISQASRMTATSTVVAFCGLSRTPEPILYSGR